MVEAFKDENIEHLLKRFKIEVERSGTLTEYKKREHFVSPSAKRHTENCHCKHLNKLASKRFKQRGY